MPELKFVTTALPAANVVRPFTSPPVIKALPVLKFVATSVVNEPVPAKFVAFNTPVLGLKVNDALVKTAAFAPATLPNCG